MDIEFIRAEARRAAATILAGGIFAAGADLLGSAIFSAELRKQLRGLKVVFSPRVGNGAVGMDILAR